MTTVYQYQANAPPYQLAKAPVKQKKSWLWYFCMGRRESDHEELQENYTSPALAGEVTNIYVVDPPGRTMSQGVRPSIANINTCSTVYSGQYAPQTSVHIGRTGQQQRVSNFRFEDNNNATFQSSRPIQPSVVIVN